MSRKREVRRTLGHRTGKRALFNIWRDNGLSIVLAGLFLVSFVGQGIAGHHEHNVERIEHGVPPVGFLTYVQGSHFWSATFENWESEFLQMFVFVVLTVYLFQRGSAESKDPDRQEAVDRDPRTTKDLTSAPRPVKLGGWILAIYERSLGLAFLSAFLVSFLLHARASLELNNAERLDHAAPPMALLEHVTGSTFWFESFQNWQSEFLSVWAMVVLTIFLRHRGSPESKPVDAPHSQTGSE